MSKIKGLTKLKLLGLGLRMSDVAVLVRAGHLIEKQDNSTGLCYYHVELPALEE